MHDTDSVIKEADAKFAAKNLDGARIIYQSALLDWVDDAREGSGGEAPDLLKDKITTLWIAYANLNKRAKMVSRSVLEIDWVRTALCTGVFLWCGMVRNNCEIFGDAEAKEYV
eukprot:CAMPEP_0113552420 /NCGR_PEP_ID=MMETSP0015_2-20120614/15057_1 /TAXON_ID=2838 /ORGANISM="Odontella" /LENGTH=112 /DNA_ID=CAMNT_0000453395 /DNA_START=277 /DNA_END=613 /DNA_ORIENTATION=+ /assembly_acc=CAM_ASM_000160